LEYDQGYNEWKAWDAEAFGQSSCSEQAYFEAELRRARLWPATGLRILEVGFGNGAFMSHAHKLGASVIGIEANAALAERATAAGLEAYAATGFERFDSGTFDAVVLFDVLEHIPQGDLTGVLREVRRVLKPGGRVVARFPNGDSPLSLASQNGDPTHITYIGSEKIRFLLGQAGLEPRYVGAPARVIWDPDFKHRLLKLAQWLPRKIVEKALKLLFFPTTPIHYFSSNLVICAVAPVGSAQAR
jgi:2-polyprenyl-3-methyl-5-hydroxy-6-metoxy-1,4-benzoquinol methylase